MSDSKAPLVSNEHAPGYQSQPPPYVAQPTYKDPQPNVMQPGGYQAQPGYQPQPGYYSSHHTTIITGAPAQPVMVSTLPRPNNWLALAIFSCLCCVWPIGLPAIIFSCMVDSSFDAGDIQQAESYSRIAKNLSLLSIIVGCIIIIVIVSTTA